MGSPSTSAAPNPAVSLQKCFHYWPEKEGTYGPFTIRVQGVSECAEYLVRDLSIQVGPSPVLGPAGDPGNVPTPPGSLASLSALSLFAPCLKAHRCPIATLGWLHRGCGDGTGTCCCCSLLGPCHIWDGGGVLGHGWFSPAGHLDTLKCPWPQGCSQRLRRGEVGTGCPALLEHSSAPPSGPAR